MVVVVAGYAAAGAGQGPGSTCATVLVLDVDVSDGSVLQVLSAVTVHAVSTTWPSGQPHEHGLYQSAKVA